MKFFENISILLEQLNDNHSNAVPNKKGKLSNEETELRESIGGRPRRQASNVKIYIYLLHGF